MKNKIFAAFIVLLVVFLAIYWIREGSYRVQLRKVNETVEELKTDLYLLNLKATQLRKELELLNFVTYLQTQKDWEVLGKKTPRGSRGL
jgi:hypothetical protein